MKILLNLLGIALVFAICWLLSYNRKAIQWKRIGIMFLVEFVIAFIIVKLPIGQKFVTVLSVVVMKVLHSYSEIFSQVVQPAFMYLLYRA